MENFNNIEQLQSSETKESTAEIQTVDSLNDLITSILSNIPEELQKDLEQNWDIQDDILDLLEQSYNWELYWDLSEFNQEKFDKDWIEGLSEHEHRLYTQALKTSVEYIIQLDWVDQYKSILEEANTGTFLEYCAEKVDFWEYLLGDEKSKSYTKMALEKWGYSVEELRIMWEKDFDIWSEESRDELKILLLKELWEWIEDLLRFIWNILSSTLLLGYYGKYRLESISSDPKTAAEGKIKKDKLVEENVALNLVELLGEKWIEMLKMIWEKMQSWKTGDIAMTLVMLASLLAWWAWLAKVGSNLARKSAVKSARKAGRQNRTAKWREYRNWFKTFSWTADNIMKWASKVDDIIWGAGLWHLAGAYSSHVWDVKHVENSHVNHDSQQVHSYIDHIETKVDIKLEGQKKEFDLEDNTKMKVILWGGWEIVIHKSEWQYYMYSEWASPKEKELARQLHSHWTDIMHINNAYILKEWEFFNLWRDIKNFNIWWSSVSRNHLSIKVTNGKIEIEDYSTNGTQIQNYQERTTNYNLRNQAENYAIQKGETMNINVLQQYSLKIYKDDNNNFFISHNNQHIKLSNKSSYVIWKNWELKHWWDEIYGNDQVMIQVNWDNITIKDNSDFGTNTSIHKEIWRNVSNKDYQRADYERYLTQKQFSLKLWDEVYVTRSSWSLERWWTIDEVVNGEYVLIREFVNGNWKIEYLERRSTLEELYTVNEIEHPKSWDASWDEVSEMKKRSFEHIKHNSQLSEQAFNALFKWDIMKQQNVGNCYLISALNSLRKSPHYETIIRLSVKKVNWGYSVKVPLWDKNWKEVFVNLQDIQPQKNTNFWKTNHFWKVDNREYLYPIDGPEWLKILEAAYWKLMTQRNSQSWEVLNRIYMEGWFWDNALIELLWSNTLERTNIRWESIHKQDWHLKNLSEKWGNIIQQVENFLDNFHPWKDIATVNTARSQWWHDNAFKVDGITFYHSHAYSITNVDRFNQIVHVTNPWNAHEVISLTYEQFMRAFSDTWSVEVRPDRFLK